MTTVSTPAPTDAVLYARWSAGDRRSGERLIARHLPCVTRFFANKCSDASELEDLVATTFERCASRLGQFRGDGKFRNYVLGIASYVFLDHLRQRYREPSFETCSLVDLASSPSMVLAKRAEARLLLRALRSLPLSLQMVLELHFFEEVTREDAAEILELPAGTIASRLRRAKRELATAIEQLGASTVESQSISSSLTSWAVHLRTLMGLQPPRKSGVGSR